MKDKSDTLKVRIKDYSSSFAGKRVFCKQIRSPSDTFFVGEKTHSVSTSFDTEILDELKPYGDIVETYRYNSFYNSELDTYLKKEQINKVYLIGMETHTSILFTAEELRNRGFEVALVEPCTASKDDYMHDYAVSLMQNYLGVELIS